MERPRRAGCRASHGGLARRGRRAVPKRRSRRGRRHGRALDATRGRGGNPGPAGRRRRPRLSPDTRRRTRWRRARRRSPAAAALLSDAAQRALRQGDPRRARWELQAAARLARATRSRRVRRVHATLLPRCRADAPRHGRSRGRLRDPVRGPTASRGRRRASAGAGRRLRDDHGAADLRAARRAHAGSRASGTSRSSGSRETLDETGRLPAHGPRRRAGSLSRRPCDGIPACSRPVCVSGACSLLRGRPREALPELERVVRESPRPAQRLHGQAVRGPHPRTAGRPAGSRGGLRRRPSSVCRAANPALVALGRALDRLGERTRAQEALRRGAAGGRKPRVDPWIGLHEGPARPDRHPGSRSCGGSFRDGSRGLLALVLAQEPPVFRAQVELVVRRRVRDEEGRAGVGARGRRLQGRGQRCRATGRGRRPETGADDGRARPGRLGQRRGRQPRPPQGGGTGLPGRARRARRGGTRDVQREAGAAPRTRAGISRRSALRSTG